MQRRVLVIYAGGTIGMRPSEQGYVPSSGFRAEIDKLLSRHADSNLPAVEMIECEQLIDSANLMPSDWSKLAALLQQNWDNYDGFVLLHGTDTMAYSASALSFMLRGLNKPVVLTGSQVPLVTLRSDAVDNLLTALLFAADSRLAEVCICFNGRLLRGNRSRKVKTSAFDAFDSPNFPWLGNAGIKLQLKQELLLAPSQPEFEIATFDANAVAILQLFPGISAALMAAVLNQPGLKGLILQSYGAGNPPDANQALIAELEQACQRGIAILNLTQCHSGSVSQGTYASGNSLNRIGVVAGSDMTLEAAFTKMHFLLSQQLNGAALTKALTTPLCGELSH